MHTGGRPGDGDRTRTWCQSGGASWGAPLAYAGAVSTPRTPDDGPTTQPAQPLQPIQPLEPIQVDSVRIVLAGLVGWAVALVVVLVVPALHTGDRSWWPWACVTGLVLGLVGLAYLLRGRGNAAGARPRR